VRLVADSEQSVAELPLLSGGGGEGPHAATAAAPSAGVDASERVRVLVEAHYDFVWRTLRYLGLADADAEDAAQQVMCVLAGRLDEIEPGAERAFLFSTARNVIRTFRRTAARRPEAPSDEMDALEATAPATDDLLDERRAHEVLQSVLHAMSVELRLVFVLYEIEELTVPAIAGMIGIPSGTVASRLRRAREEFQAIVQRMKAAAPARRGNP
jgi:RNA polymerase sigma-70 factor (ECF subfamily)